MTRECVYVSWSDRIMFHTIQVGLWDAVLRVLLRHSNWDVTRISALHSASMDSR